MHIRYNDNGINAKILTACPPYIRPLVYYVTHPPQLNCKLLAIFAMANFVATVKLFVLSLSLLADLL